MKRYSLIATAILVAASWACRQPAQTKSESAVSGSAAATAETTPAPAEEGKVAAAQPAETRPAGEAVEPRGTRAPAETRAASAPAASEPTEPVRKVAPPPTSAAAPKLVLAEGTTLDITMETTASSASAKVGDRIVAKVATGVELGGRTVVPAGSELRGRVTAAQPSGRVKGRARLAVAFDELIVKGKAHAIEASSLDVTAGGQGKRDAAIVGGGAAAGAIVGGITKGGKGAAVGGLIGAGAGGAAVLATKGKEVVFEAGSAYAIKLTRGLTLD